MSRATKKATNHAYMNGGKLSYDDIFLNVKTVLQFFKVNKRVVEGSKFIYFSFSLTELLCMVEMMLPPKNHEISNPAPGVFPKLS